MKKELLIASALTASFGLAGVAEAATASFSGNVRTGVSGDDTDGTADATYGADQKASISFSVSETTDAGVKMSTGFTMVDEGTDDGADPCGLTLSFSDGSKLDLIEAGNAYATHTAAVPGASGEQGITGETDNSAPSGLNFANASDKVGFEWHSAADALGVDGLKWGVSAAFGDDTADAVSTSSAESSYSVGVSYVTTAGDTTVTIGGGYVNASDSNAATLNEKADEMSVAVTAATGDLTIGAGFASGSMIASASTAADAAEVDGAEVVTVGAKYVTGDITMSVGYVDGEAKDTTDLGDQADTTVDAYNATSASVDYAVAAGVTATVGYTSVESSDEGVSDTANSGTSWYIGTNISF
jgi:hypothetical protein